MIPVRNIYFLLCYAWNRLDESTLVDIDAIPYQDLPNLIARLLINGVKRMLRQGIDRQYVARAQDTQCPKGKIDISASLKKGLLPRNAVTCLVDELNQDVLHNQIIRTTLRNLASAVEVEKDQCHELRVLEKRLDDVSVVNLRSEHFARVQLHRNIVFYRFLLHVCELCFFCLLPDEQAGQHRFREFVRDEVRMRRVFEDFVYNFYRLEQTRFKVASERLNWDCTYADPEAMGLLPEMRTDVSLNSGSRKIVIECKYTSKILQDRWGKLSSRSIHLYQLFAYLKHLEARGGANRNCEGLLLYPSATPAVDFMFKTQGHVIRVVTLDLREDWEEIKKQLLNLLNPWELNAGPMYTQESIGSAGTHEASSRRLQ